MANTNAATPSPVTSLSEGTIILNLMLGRVSNRKKMSSHTSVIQTEMDRDSLHLSKDLFEADELEACFRFLWGLKGRIKQKTIPSPHLRGGMYHVKLEAVKDVEEILDEAIEEFKPLVQAFVDVVDVRREEAKERLGPAYIEAEFPTPLQVKEAFSIKYNWLSIGTPSSLKTISKALFERESKKAQESLKVAVADITTLLTVEAKKLADHLVERLKPGKDGKTKVFRNTITENITEFLANFSLRDVGSSEELNAQIKRMRALIDGVSPEDLRKSDKLREDVAKGFGEVSKAFDAIVINKPKRYIDVDELDGE